MNKTHSSIYKSYHLQECGENNATGYTGVYRAHSKAERYTSSFRYKGKYYHVGTFDTAKEAAQAREQALNAFLLDKLSN